MRAAFVLLALFGCAAQAAVDDADPYCGWAFDPAIELVDPARRAAARWSDATGCDMRIEAGGVRVYAQPRVYLDWDDQIVHDDDPDGTRQRACGATLTRPKHGAVAIYIATEVCDAEESLTHEMGHTLAKPGTHATQGVGAAAGSELHTPWITASTLEWACQTTACLTFEPETPVCDLGDANLILDYPTMRLVAGDEQIELERIDRHAANVGNTTVVYYSEPYEHIAIVKPASAIEYVALDTCRVPEREP